MKEETITPEECFIYGQQLARLITDAHYKKYGHIQIGEFTAHHYLLLFAVPFFEDECMKAFIAGAALDDLPDLIDDLFPNSDFAKKVSDSIREFRGEEKRHNV